MFPPMVTRRIGIWILAGVLCHLQNAAAQENISIRGRVLDEETKKHLSFASLRIIGNPIGTITNDDGEFSFIVPSKYLEDTLIVSMIGYTPFRTRVQDIALQQLLVIGLKGSPIQLKEVVITDTRLTAREIILKAFENIENNYPSNPYIMNAFYRETHQENNKTVILVEAAMDIYDTGYKLVRSPKVKEKVTLRSVRASKNYRHNLFKNTVVERYNLVNSGLRWNPIKYRSTHIRKDLADKEPTIDSVVYSNNKLVYVISFLSYIQHYPLFEKRHTLHIDAENYTILKYGWDEYAKKGKYSETAWRLTKDSVYFTYRKRISTIYEYENYNGKMFLKYFDEKCYDDIYNTKGDSVEFEALGHTTLIITGIQTENVTPGTKNPMIPNKSIYDQATSHNPDVWNKDEHLLPLTRKQKTDLEWEMPLSDQFLLNARQD